MVTITLFTALMLYMIWLGTYLFITFMVLWLAWFGLRSLLRTIKGLIDSRIV